MNICKICKIRQLFFVENPMIYRETPKKRFYTAPRIMIYICVELIFTGYKDFNTEFIYAYPVYSRNSYVLISSVFN